MRASTGVTGWVRTDEKPAVQWLANPCVNAFGSAIGQSLPRSFRAVHRLLSRYVEETPLAELPEYMDLLVNADAASFYSTTLTDMWMPFLNATLMPSSSGPARPLLVYLGCYREEEPGRVFPIRVDAASNVHRCAALAASLHTNTFALQRHGECWLAQGVNLSLPDVSRYGASQLCNVDCEPSRLAGGIDGKGIGGSSAGQLCGAAMVNSVYQLQELVRDHTSPWLVRRFKQLKVLPYPLVHLQPEADSTAAGLPAGGAAA